MTTTRRQLATLLFTGLFGAAFALAGCGGNGQVTQEDEPATAANAKQKEKREPKAPMPDNLDESPCGNPKWGQLPEQHEIDGDPDEGETADGEPSDDQPANDEANDN